MVISLASAMGCNGSATAGGQSVSVTYTPTALSSDQGDLANPLRGQYRWIGTSPYPAGWTANDSYQRWNWIDLEPSEGNYDWERIDAALEAARARRGRFGMRVMPLCQGCSGHLYKGAYSAIPDDLADTANVLIGSAPGLTDNYVLPDWNSEVYLTRLETLLRAIAARYRDDPTFAFVDVSSYGNWGEFHLWPFIRSGGAYDGSTQQPITDDNARRIVQMNASAFSNKLLVINSENAAALTEAIASTSPLIGLRVDCLGSDGLAGGENAMSEVPGSEEHWRKAPFITEWCQYNLGTSGANLFVQGEQQVRDYHVSMLSSGNFSSDPSTDAEVEAFTTANVEAGYRLRVASMELTVSGGGLLRVAAEWVNDNVAPTYLAWNVILGLTGPEQVEVPLSVDLRQVMPDALLDTDETVQASSALSAGSYQVTLRVEDAQGISLPMYLAMDGRDEEGNYALGTIEVP